MLFRGRIVKMNNISTCVKKTFNSTGTNARIYMHCISIDNYQPLHNQTLNGTTELTGAT